MPRSVLNIAHRGARAFAPENTLEAIEKASRFAADMVELDVHLSRDGELIVHHDDDLVRCSDVRLRFPHRSSYFVSDFTAAEIRTLDAGSWYPTELQKSREGRQPFLRTLTDVELREFVPDTDLQHYRSGRVRVPTLPECLQCADRIGLLINVEIKAIPRFYPGIAEMVVGLVESLGMTDRVIISSFDHQQLAVVRQLSSAIATAVLTSDRLFDPAAYIARVLDADAYNPGCSEAHDSIGFGSVGEIVDVTTIKAARAAGLGVHVWTENDPDRMARLVRAGVTGVFTDYPNRLREVLETNGS